MIAIAEEFKAFYQRRGEFWDLTPKDRLAAIRSFKGAELEDAKLRIKTTINNIDQFIKELESGD